MERKQKTVKTPTEIEIRAPHQQPKMDNININNSKRSSKIGFSSCGETYLKNHVLFYKQEPIYITTKTLNQYRNVNAQTSDEIQLVEIYENSTVVFDDGC